MQEQKQGTCRTLSTFVVVCSRSRSRLKEAGGHLFAEARSVADSGLVPGRSWDKQQAE